MKKKFSFPLSYPLFPVAFLEFVFIYLNNTCILVFLETVIWFIFNDIRNHCLLYNCQNFKFSSWYILPSFNNYQSSLICVGLSPHSSLPSFFFFFFFNFYTLFIYLFLTVLGLCFCARAFSSCGKRRPLFIAVRRPLTVAASLVAEHRLQTRRLSTCGSQAQLLRGMWDLPRPGLEPVSPALAGRLSTTAPPGKPPPCPLNYFKQFLNVISSYISFFDTFKPRANNCL